jgi:hypothetical protein
VRHSSVSDAKRNGARQGTVKTSPREAHGNTFPEMDRTFQSETDRSVRPISGIDVPTDVCPRTSRAPSLSVANDAPQRIDRSASTLMLRRGADALSRAVVSTFCRRKNTGIIR